MDKEKIYTPVLKSTGVRMKMENAEWIEKTKFADTRIPKAYKGIIKDTKTDKLYKIYGKACSLSNCGCDAYAVEITKVVK